MNIRHLIFSLIFLNCFIWQFSFAHDGHVHGTVPQPEECKAYGLSPEEYFAVPMKRLSVDSVTVPMPLLESEKTPDPFKTVPANDENTYFANRLRALMAMSLDNNDCKNQFTRVFAENLKDRMSSLRTQYAVLDCSFKLNRGIDQNSDDLYQKNLNVWHPQCLDLTRAYKALELESSWPLVQPIASGENGNSGDVSSVPTVGGTTDIPKNSEGNN